MRLAHAVSALVLVVVPAHAQSAALFAAAYGGTVPPQCSGTSIDLSHIDPTCLCVIQRRPFQHKGQTTISARSSCGDAIEQRDLAGLVDLGVAAAPAIIHGGDPITFVVTITNKTQSDLPVVLEDTGPFLVRDLHIADANGREVARDDRAGKAWAARRRTTWS